MNRVMDAIEALKAEILALPYSAERSRNVEALDEILKLCWDHIANEAGL